MKKIYFNKTLIRYYNLNNTSIQKNNIIIKKFIDHFDKLNFDDVIEFKFKNKYNNIIICETFENNNNILNFVIESKYNCEFVKYFSIYKDSISDIIRYSKVIHFKKIIKK